jgi:hypothetical protein
MPMSIAIPLAYVEHATRSLSVLLLRLLTLSEPLSEQAVPIPLHLELWTQPNIGLDLSLRLLIEARHIFLTESCHKQCKLQLSLTLLQTKEGSKFLFELLIPYFLSPNFTAFVALGWIDVTSA